MGRDRLVADRPVGAQPGLAAHQTDDGQPRSDRVGLLVIRLCHRRRSGRRRGLCSTCKARARQRGIRLASDMVPNHMGIDSRWVIEHPDWFIALDLAPFPRTRSTVPICRPMRASASRSKIITSTEPMRRSSSSGSITATGETSYIYHGNDGTSMPWNDTAQLNYLNAGSARSGHSNRFCTLRAASRSFVLMPP